MCFYHSIVYVIAQLCGFQVVMVNQAGSQLACEYGSTGKEQSLNHPLSLFRINKEHFLVVDSNQHRIHLLNNNLQFVRHLICRQNPKDRMITYPRHVCFDGTNLYVGNDSGTVSVFQIK